ncbi:MAG: shikimate kinase [Clostridia bacterium]|nr:shikimate kinase [Clostridia bacterium]
MKNIYLIGMPGCGKSTVAKILAQKLNMSLADTDSIIESKFGSIPEIFKMHGEQYFRKLETETLKQIKDNTVVSTGGGIVKVEENTELMSKGIVVFIDTPPEVLKTRDLFENRPLLKSNCDIEKLYNERYDLYKEQADITVDGNNSPMLVAKEIVKSVK